MRSNYSRYQRLEEGRNVRRAIIFAILTILVIVALFVVGIPAVTGVAGFIFDRRGSSTIGLKDTTPPGPPFVNTPPEGTNKQSIKIEGTSEPDATIVYLLNEAEGETTADSSGKFSISLTLKKGQNTISAKARDKAGNESARSKTFFVFYSNEAPQLDISKPHEGDTFYGEKQKSLTIEGKTCPTCTVTINDRIATVQEDGSFTLSYQLGDGSNVLNFKTTDKAGNQTEKNVSVTFSP